MSAQGTKIQERRAVNRMKYDTFERTGNRLSRGALAYCDHCGAAIYRPCDLLMIAVNGDKIHRDCWPEYAEEHMFDFAVSADSEHLDCKR